MNKSIFEKYLERFSYEPGGKDFPKQVAVIEEVWKLLDAGKSLEAARVITRYQKEGAVTPYEPILAALILRVGRDIVDNQRSSDDLTLDVSRMLAKQGAQDLIASIGMLQKPLVGSEDEMVKEIYLNLSVMMRYGLYHYRELLEPEREKKFFAEGEIYDKLWKVFRPDVEMDHTGVDPFVLALCPPPPTK